MTGIRRSHFLLDNLCFFSLRFANTARLSLDRINSSQESSLKPTFLDCGGELYFYWLHLLLGLQLHHLVDLLVPEFPEPDVALLVVQHPVWLHSDTETFVEPAKQGIFYSVFRSSIDSIYCPLGFFVLIGRLMRQNFPLNRSGF